ncbi:hypothetical protein [Streptomyces sp. NRRL WC-3742]|uniref:hypothetical protein n=1 Tax=Streptomyces sp. NRRL WC-3742 TaxID=1463934 RepID=UPI0004CBC331|nr:hypothetical protein [Streptomyces sp. NRRL WC-3742]
MTSDDVEQVAAESLRVASIVALSLADLAATDDRYDQLGALAAASSATEATCYLPLPLMPAVEGSDRLDHQGVIRLAGHLEELADELDELGRRSTDLRQIRDRHMAALHSRDAAIALRSSLPVEESSV